MNSNPARRTAAEVISLVSGVGWMALCGLGSGRAEAATWRVPQDFPGIQAAVNAAAPGDTILVLGPEDDWHDPVIYEENIVVTKPVTLSWNREADGGYIRPIIRPRDRRRPAVTLANSSNIALIGLCIRNKGGVGVWASNTRNLLIRDCLIEGCGTGLRFDAAKNKGARDTRLFNNDIRSNALYGICTTWNHRGDWLLQHNRMEKNRIGLLALPGRQAFPDLACRIHDNDMTGHAYAGLWIASPPGRLEVLRNRIQGNRPYGAVIHEARSLQLANNLLMGNTIGLWLIEGRLKNSALAGEAANNAALRNSSAGIRLTAGRGAPNLKVLNNIVAFNEGQGFAVQGRPFRGALAYNDFFQNAGGHFGGLAANAVGRQGNISVDPELIANTGDLAGNYHPGPASPCLQAGEPSAPYRNFDGTRNDMGPYGGPARQPVMGWAMGHRGLAALYVDHGRGDIMQVHSNLHGILCRANPFNGGAWIATFSNSFLNATGQVIAVDGQGRELQRFSGFDPAQDVWQNVELSVDPRDGSCWVAETRQPSWQPTIGRLTKLTLDGRVAAELFIPDLTDVEVVRADGLVAVSCGDTQAVVRFYTSAGLPVASATVCADTPIGLAVDTQDNTLVLAGYDHWARLSLDAPGTVLSVGPGSSAPATASVTVDPRGGNILVTAFAEDASRTSLHTPAGDVLRRYDIQDRNCETMLSSGCDVDPYSSFFLGYSWLWDERRGNWFDGIAFLDPDLAEPVSLLDFRGNSLSLLRPRFRE